MVQGRDVRLIGRFRVRMSGGKGRTKMYGQDVKKQGGSRSEYTGWGDESWTAFCEPAANAVGGL